MQGRGEQAEEIDAEEVGEHGTLQVYAADDDEDRKKLGGTALDQWVCCWQLNKMGQFIPQPPQVHVIVEDIVATPSSEH